MNKQIKTIRRFHQLYKSLNFSELMMKADDEFLELVVEMDSAGNVLRESKFDNEGELEERNEYTYSEAGKLLDHELYYAIDDVAERRIFKRDEKGRLLEEVKVYGEDEGEKLLYSYDEKDRVIAFQRFDEEGELDYREEFVYDEQGDLLQRRKYAAAGHLLEELSAQRGELLVVEEKSYDSNGNLESTSITKFDASGREVSNVQSNTQGKLISSVITVYDDRGNALERVYKDFYSKTVRYEYDANDKMITQELFDNTGLLLRKNIYEYDPDGQLIAEQVFEIDASRGGRDKHYGMRFEYDYHA